jgi:hypothetical protein
MDFAGADTLSPPTLPDAAPPIAAVVTAESEEGDTGPLYAPVVDKANGLTYIDICLKAGKGGRR